MRVKVGEREGVRKILLHKDSSKLGAGRNGELLRRVDRRGDKDGERE